MIFLVYSWRPGRGEGYKRSEVCQTCAKTRNVCQSCILDLEFGLPSQLRDAVLSREDDQVSYVPPESDINREYQLQQRIAMLNSGTDMQADISERVISIARNNILNRAKPRVTVPVAPSALGKRSLPAYSSQGEEAHEHSTELSVVGFDPLVLVPSANNGFLIPPPPPLTTSAAKTNSSSSSLDAVGSDTVASAPSTTTTTTAATAVKKASRKKAVALAPKPPSGQPPATAFLDVSSSP